MINKPANSQALIIGISNGYEDTCACSARISTQPGSALEIYEKSLNNPKNSNLIDKVLNSGHKSVIEHTYFNIAFSDVSVMVEQFIIEFRLGAYTVKSRRYVDFSNVGYYTPNLPDEPWKNKYLEIYSDHMDNLFDEYQFFLDNGIPKEDARFVLPYCYRSNFYCSVNARELTHILDCMINGRGKKFEELYNLGLSILEQAKKMCPGIFSSFSDKAMNDEYDFSDVLGDFKSSTQTNANDVELLDYTKDAGKKISKIALSISNQISFEDIDKIINDEDKCEKIIKKIISSARPRELESLNYTFKINNVSLAGLTHFVRHRLQSISVPSLISVDKSTKILPPLIKNNPELLNRYIKIFENNNKVYESLKSIGIPEEYLVYFNLSGNTLDIITTLNARELLLFLKLRTCTRAQWEIRGHAIEMLRQLREVSPEIFSYYGPSCFTQAKCPEGKLTCGKIVEIRKEFNKL